MSAQPEALRLADVAFAARDARWHTQADDELRRLHVDAIEAAAELRRLHQFAEDQIGRATAAEAALQMTKATHALKIAAVEAQRDSLLEACRAMLTFIERHAPRGLQPEPGSPVAMARAAIAAVEGENHAKNL
jgi:hypothetical protein